MKSQRLVCRLVGLLGIGVGVLATPVGAQGCPELVGSYDTLGVAWGVAVAGAYAYVADGSAGLEVLTSCEGLLFQDGFESGTFSACFRHDMPVTATYIDIRIQARTGGRLCVVVC